MAGAWELANHQSVLCAILHTDVTTVAWAFALRSLQIPGKVVGLCGMPYDHARNSACQQALEMGFSYVFFLDSDVFPPPDAVLRLMSRNQPLISGLYCRRSPPAGVPVMIRKGQWVSQFPQNAIIDVDMVGSGCMLIHRSVLERLPESRPGKRWFDWRVDMRGVKDPTGKEIYPPDQCTSEDFTFCLNVRKHLGIRTLVDTSVKCKHVGFAQVEFGSLQPLDNGVSA